MLEDPDTALSASDNSIFITDTETWKWCLSGTSSRGRAVTGQRGLAANHWRFHHSDLREQEEKADNPYGVTMAAFRNTAEISGDF